MEGLQESVRAFIQEYDLSSDPQSRLLDLMSEVGEVAKEALLSTDYGKARVEQTQETGQLCTASMEDELGDVLFSYFSLCDSLGVDAEKVLAHSLQKYRDRFAAKATVGSGERVETEPEL